MSIVLEKMPQARQPRAVIKHIRSSFGSLADQLRRRLGGSPPRMTAAPIRGLLMSTDQLEQRIRDLAELHGEVTAGGTTRSLIKMLDQQERVLRKAFKAFSADIPQPAVTPAAEWLLGNMHVTVSYTHLDVYKRQHDTINREAK